MDRIPPPILSSSELDEAVVKITQVLDAMQVRYGVIGSTAINFYARHYGFPHRSTSSISILIQPTAKVSAMDISAKFSVQRYAKNFVCWMINGIRAPKVIIRRPGQYADEKLFVGFKLLDHYTYPDRREHYDFDMNRRMNRIVFLKVNGSVVRLLNAPWLLRQKIFAWGGRQSSEKRSLDELDTRTLRDILEIQKRKVVFNDEVEVEALNAFVACQHDNPADFRCTIHCPELLGPWWEVRWIKVVLFMLSVLFLGVSMDFASSTTKEVKVETIPRLQELWQDI